MCVFVCCVEVLSDRSCPYLYVGLLGWADLSLLKPLQRDQGWAGEVREAKLANAAAAAMGFGTGVKVGRWRDGARLGVMPDGRGVARVFVCDRRAETEGIQVGVERFFYSTVLYVCVP